MLVVFRFLTWVAAVAGGAACCALALAGQAGRWSETLDLINHAAPFLLLGGLLCALLSLIVATRWARWLGAGLGVTGALIAGVQVVPVLTRGGAQAAQALSVPKDAPRLKVVQISFYHANPEPSRSVDWLLSQNADVIVMEEAEGMTGEARTRLLAAYPYINDYTDMTLSRWPIRSSGNFIRAPRPTNMYFNGGYTVIEGPGGPFTVVGVHYTWPWPVRFQARQRRDFAAYVRRLPRDGAIIAGDLNSTPWSFGLRRLETGMGLNRITHGLFTFPARAYRGRGDFDRLRELPGVFPFAAIDHIFAGSSWRAVKVERGPRLGSDHFPIVAELAWVG